MTGHNLVHSKLKWEYIIYEGLELAIRSLKLIAYNDQIIETFLLMDVNLHGSPVQCLAPKHPTKCAVVLQTNL